MHIHKNGIESSLSETKIYLDKLHQEISKTLEKIGSREKYINNQVGVELRAVWISYNVCMQLGGPVQEFRSCQDRLSEVREKYKSAGTSVNDLARELAQVLKTKVTTNVTYILKLQP